MLNQKSASFVAAERVRALSGTSLFNDEVDAPLAIPVTIVALPTRGAVFRRDGVTPVRLGHALSITDLTALKYTSPMPTKNSTSAGMTEASNAAAGGDDLVALATGREEETSWPVLCISQGSPPTPLAIGLPIDDKDGGQNVLVHITAIPSNGIVLLSDARTSLAQGEVLTASQFEGLLFDAAPGACGKISTLSYKISGSPQQTDESGVLVVVGPPAPALRTVNWAAVADNGIVASLTAALLLDTALSSSKLSAAISPEHELNASKTDASALLLPHPVPSPADLQLTGQNAAATSALGMSVSNSPGSFEANASGQTVVPTEASPVKAVGSSVLPLAVTPRSLSALPQGNPTSTETNGVVGGSLQQSALKTNVASPLSNLPVTSGSTDPQQFSTLAVTGASSPQQFSTLAVTGAAVTTNRIVSENQKPGTPQDIWQIDPGQDSTLIQGFTTAISTNVGNAVNFKINNLTSNPNYHIDIYRLGYYGGDGATLVTTIQHQAATAVHQPNPLTDPSTGLVDAGNWSVTDTWNVPTTATSGVYIANVIDGNQIFQMPFVVRDDSSHSDIVFQTADETWQAYNGWGGSNLYSGNGPGPGGAAYAVSYNRPIISRDGEAQGSKFATPNDMVFSAEYPLIYWLEQNGYDVSYVSGLDVSLSGSLLQNHRAYIEAGHDEYWTDSQRANVQAAVNAGVNLVFLSGNEMYWQTRFAPSINSTGDANRTLVTYKDTHANALIDPSGTATSTFMDARFASTGGMAGNPSNSLTGTLFAVDANRADTIKIPYDMTQLRFWRNTPVASTTPGQSASLIPTILGYEWDSSPDNGFRPAGLVGLSSTTLQVNTKLLDYGNTTGDGTATHNLVEYRDPVSGALVFGAGTVFWTWGLSTEHDDISGPMPPVDKSIQQSMVNLFADMGIQPATLQASLLIASQSTDHTAPTSTITQLSATQVVEGKTVTVSGTASDVGGVIGGVEVSSDGGVTWHPATSSVGTANVSWSYSFVAGAPGSINVRSRAVDDSLNLEAPGAGVSYKVTPSSNLSLFNTTDTPAVVANVDPSSVELGVKFVSATSGEINGIRFYKGTGNTGTHIGDLWTSDGKLLASATFTNETASGWQQVTFASPVRIQAGVSYVASYHTDTGHYSSTDFYFDNPGHTTGSLTAIGNGLNGMFAYGQGPIFPGTVSFATGDNYWLDVVFNDTSQSPQAGDDSGFVVSGNGTLSIPAATLLANDTDPNGLSFSITSVGNSTNGTVAYNATTKVVTFSPSTGFGGLATFNYSITDTQGATGTGKVSVNVSFPTSAESLFGTNATPSLVDSGDASAVEVGVKFVAAKSGAITGIRFYKGPQNIGTHIADLWTASGTLLASATFTNESASGWQEINFAHPVAISAGTTYVASYHTNGHYAVNSSFFTAPLTSGDLTAPATANGVFSYGTGTAFPTSTFNASNYWVDVVFDATATQLPVANNDTGFVVVKGGSLAIAASALLANDTDPAGLPLSITGVSSPTNGTVSYDAVNKIVTFVPTAGYSGPATFSYSISDGQSVAGPASVSLTVSSSPPPVANNDSGFTVLRNGSISISAASLLANDTDPGGLPLSITGVSSPTNGTVSYDAASKVITFVPTAGYTGPAGFSYSITDGQGTAGPANVALTVAVPQLPVANNDSGFSVTGSGPLSISASQLLANDTDPNGLPLSIAGVSSPTNGTVSYDAVSKIVTFTPTAGYVGAAGFSYTISDGSGGTASANVALFVNPAGSESLFSLSSVPGTISSGDTNSVELGVRFTASADGSITGIRFYKGPQNTGAHVANLWTSTGTLLATGTFTNESASGWQQVNFASPVSITPGATYVASYHTNGFYSADANYFSNSVVSGDLTAPAGTNGTYAYGTGSLFPTNTFNASNYWVDVIYAKSSQPVAVNDSGFVVAKDGSLTIAASTLLANDRDPNGLPLSISNVSAPANGTVSYDSTAKSVTFVPTAGYTGPASFKYSVSDANGGSATAQATLDVTDQSIVSLFDKASTPSIVTVNDTSSVELGFKFQASSAGQVLGIRFYKGPQNTGPHVADLWSSTGSLLATATFTNETASGWQQVNFATPISITAGTTYVASYHTNGDYSADPNLFATAISNGPLTAPSSASSGGNGVYAYGSSSLFPNSSFNSTSYGVDVLFKSNLAA